MVFKAKEPKMLINSRLFCFESIVNESEWDSVNRYFDYYINYLR